MKLLHTSDWHLGQRLISKDRKNEHECFLKWISDYISQNPIDALIIAGDIFDSCNPPNYAFELYYNFLGSIFKTSPNTTVVVIGGNHDSPSSLEAPKQLLKLFNIHVTGGISSNIEDDIIMVKSKNDELLGIICAVPYLRERDIIAPVLGESYEIKNEVLIDAIKKHYEEIKNKAIELKNSISSKKIPMIATGHLFTKGGSVSDGIRDIYVGSIGHIDSSIFPSEFDYLALGHLHKPQKTGNNGKIRYSGSPIPLSFGESKTPKQIIKIDFDNDASTPNIDKIDIPEFQKLKIIKGNFEEIENELKSINKGDNIWIEVHANINGRINELRSMIGEYEKQLDIEVLAIKNINPQSSRLEGSDKIQTLHQITSIEVFKRKLDSYADFTDNEKNELMDAYKEIVAEIENS
ncbi:MAG: exonuclease SbcCD subunit D C-terminal domain-containing protein [Desulfobacterales bacterium]|nr:exonuclease SbcCD subunit D C-terminal domain-containing protein [Desulfobacterales bacterium]